MFDTIILALNAESDIVVAARMLEKFTPPVAAELHVVCVVSAEFALVPKPGEDAKMESEECPAAAEEETNAHQIVREFAEGLQGPGHITVTAVLTGEPAPEIVKYANNHKADLIIMAHRHLSWFSRLRDPSVCHQVIEHAPCPVLVMPGRGSPAVKSKQV
jgi:nucleotide-binding universal stress UspA family protein